MNINKIFRSFFFALKNHILTLEFTKFGVHEKNEKKKSIYIYIISNSMQKIFQQGKE